MSEDENGEPLVVTIVENGEGGRNIKPATDAYEGRHENAKRILGSHWKNYREQASVALSLLPDLELLDAVHEAVLEKFTSDDLLDDEKREKLLATLSQISLARIPLVNAENERLKKFGGMFTPAELAQIFSDFFELIMKYLKEPEDRKAAAQDIRKLSGRTGIEH